MGMVTCMAAADAGDQEALVGMLSGIVNEALHGSSQALIGARGGDGVAASLRTLGLTDDCAKVLYCGRRGTAVVRAVNIAAEDKDLALGQLDNRVGGDAVGIVGPGIGAAHGHFLLTAIIDVEVAVHPLVVGALRRTVAVPGVGGAHHIMVKLHDMVDRELHGHLQHIVAGAHVGEGPAFFLELLDEMAQGLARPLARGVFHAVGDDGDHGCGVLVVLDEVMQARQRLAHRIKQRRAATGMVVVEIRDLGNGHGGHVQADGWHGGASRVKREQGEVVLLGVGKVFLRLLDGGDGLVDTANRYFLQTAHRAALVYDDEVVDLCLLGVDSLLIHVLAVLAVLDLIVHSRYFVKLLIIVCLMRFMLDSSGGLALLDVDVLGIATQHKQGHGAQPDFALKAIKACDIVERASCQRMLSLLEASVAGLVQRLVAGNDVDVGKSVIVTQEGAQFVGTGHHHQVMVVKRPAGEVDIPLPVFLVVELETVLTAAAKYTVRHYLCSVEQIVDGIIHNTIVFKGEYWFFFSLTLQNYIILKRGLDFCNLAKCIFYTMEISVRIILLRNFDTMNVFV